MDQPFLWASLERQAEALFATSTDPLAQQFASRVLRALAHYGIKDPPVSAEGRVGRSLWLRSGTYFWPLDPRPEEVLLSDIVWSLAHINRFGGHACRPYSVLTHTILVQDITRWLTRGNAYKDGQRVEFSPEEARAREQDALLHDATECYADDVRKPLKELLWGYNAIEYQIARAVGARFGLGDRLADLDPLVQYADALACAVEARDLCGNPQGWSLPPAPDEFVTVEETPQAARARFLGRFYELFPEEIPPQFGSAA